jgi:hypothetical protein
MLISIVGTGTCLAIPVGTILEAPGYAAIIWPATGLVLFSLVWSAYAVAMGVAALRDAADRRRIAAGLARGLIGGALGAGAALSIAAVKDAEIGRLMASQWFYVLAIPAVAGLAGRPAFRTRRDGGSGGS